MRINLKKQAKEEDIQSILYLGIMFSDIDCISKFYIQKENLWACLNQSLYTV